MTALRMADATSVGQWDAAAWARIVERRADSTLLDGPGRYLPEQVARVIYGRWPR